MKKLGQIQIRKPAEIGDPTLDGFRAIYLETINGSIIINSQIIYPEIITCEVLEFLNAEDSINLRNPVSIDAVDVTLTEEDLNQFGSLRAAAKSKLIGVE